MMIANVEERLALARRRLADGTDREKVTAAGNLAVLDGEKAMLDARMKELDAAPDGSSEDAYQWLKEEWFNLMLRLDDWIAGG